jgi:hypothetical protein
VDVVAHPPQPINSITNKLISPFVRVGNGMMSLFSEEVERVIGAGFRLGLSIAVFYELIFEGCGVLVVDSVLKEGCTVLSHRSLDCLFANLRQ